MYNSEELKEHLQDLTTLMGKLPSRNDWVYRGYEDLILQCGRVMEPKPLPKNIKPGQPRLCYANSQHLVFKNPALTYVEGYAMAQGVSFPLHHAWLLDADGYAIDPTWEPYGCCYLGVPLAASWVKSILKSRRQLGRTDELSILQGNYLEGFFILKQGYPTEALCT